MSQAAYDFSLFEKYNFGTAAPELTPDYQSEETVEIPVKKNGKKTKSNNRSKNTKLLNGSTIASLMHSAVIVSAVVFVLGFVFYAMHLNTSLDEKANMINKVESEIEIAKNEQIKLNSELNGVVSFDKIKDYAENTLGMVKLESYKITYFDAETENKVILSGGKSYESGLIH